MEWAVVRLGDLIDISAGVIRMPAEIMKKYYIIQYRVFGKEEIVSENPLESAVKEDLLPVDLYTYIYVYTSNERTHLTDLLRREGISPDILRIELR